MSKKRICKGKLCYVPIENAEQLEFIRKNVKLDSDYYYTPTSLQLYHCLLPDLTTVKAGDCISFDEFKRRYFPTFRQRILRMFK